MVHLTFAVPYSVMLVGAGDTIIVLLVVTPDTVIVWLLLRQLEVDKVPVVYVTALKLLSFVNWLVLVGTDDFNA